MVLGVDVVAGNGGLRCLPAVERIELREIIAGRGCEKRVCVIDEFGVRRGVGQSKGQEEGGGSQERRCEHGDGWKRRTTEKGRARRVKFEI